MHTTRERMGLGIYLYQKFLEEDGDGINIVIMSEKRIELEKKMEELVCKLTPVKVDEQGNKYYYVSDLDKTLKKAKRLIRYDSKP